MKTNCRRRVFVCVTLFLVSGCRASGGGTQPEPAVTSVPRPRRLAEVVTPLESYIGTAQDRHTLARAGDVVNHDCMRRLGLEWPVEPPRVLRNTLQAWDLGFMPADDVPGHGYHPPGLQADLDVSVGGSASGPRILSRAQRAAYIGAADPSVMEQRIPPGGCVAEVQRRLDRGAPGVDDSAAIILANQTGELALADSRVVAVTRAWSDCMKDKGNMYSSPYEARDDPRWNDEAANKGGAVVSAAEERTAQADLECRRRVNYLGVRLAVISAYQNREIQARPAEFALLRKQLGERLRNAEDVLR